MKPIEELGIVVGIFAGIWTLAQAFGKSGGNTCGVPASAPSGTVQTTPFAGTAPSIPVPQLTNPFTTAFPTFKPVGGGYQGCAPISISAPLLPRTTCNLQPGQSKTLNSGPLGTTWETKLACGRICIASTS